MRTIGVSASALVVFLSAAMAASCSTAGGSADAGAGGGAAAGGRAAGRGGARGAGAPVPVMSVKAEARSVPLVIPAVGTVEAIASAQIRAQVTGQLTAVHFREGQDVQQGQPLFSLDARTPKAALAQAEAVLARDTASLKNAQSQQQRTDTLLERGIISKDQADSQRASSAALAATVEADKAAIETARLNVQYAEITAPISGRTGALGNHVGDMVRANDTLPLVIVNQVTPIYVTFSVPGRFLPEIRKFQAERPLAVGATVGPLIERGVVTFIDNAIDTTTGTIRLRATFANAVAKLWPGSFVQVTLELTTEAAAVVVPAVAIQASQDGQYVFVIKPDRTVEMRTVHVARQQGDLAVMADGLAAGEEVVTDGHLRLTPGAKVVTK